MAAKVTLNDDQTAAFTALKRFIAHPAVNTFVLKGYAGTGKTFLMQHLGKWLKANNHHFSLLASTGRAASVLRGKTGFEAKTVHGELYRFNRVDGDNDELGEDDHIDKYGQMKLVFAIRIADTEEKRVYIIDESSMLSSEFSDSQSTTSFGSGVLLDDFFQAIGSNKVIFVGDPGQLPPVGQLVSPALDVAWLTSEGRLAIEFSLEKIERQSDENDILVLASGIRSLLGQAVLPNYPKFPCRLLNNVTVFNSEQELFEKYVERYRESGPNQVLAVARSNRKVAELNKTFRQDYFGAADHPVQKGDILLVIQNNYSVPLTNGDFVEICELGDLRTKANLHFQSVRVKALLSELEYEILISLDILYSEQAQFSEQQSKALMVEFSKKMKKKGIKANSEEYKDEMMKDDFLNCLKAKYGYAVTCHKAQGGEWPEVFLFLEKSMYGMKRPELFSWWYTAVTRAKERLYVHNDWWISNAHR